MGWGYIKNCIFLLTRPMRGATHERSDPPAGAAISTHTPHAGRDVFESLKMIRRPISTHTPHAGRDAQQLNRILEVTISTHTPHAGRDDATFLVPSSSSNFYSHAPCGARPYTQKKEDNRIDFYSHAPCGARLLQGYQEIWQL